MLVLPFLIIGYWTGRYASNAESLGFLLDSLMSLLTGVTLLLLLGFAIWQLST